MELKDWTTSVKQVQISDLLVEESQRPLSSALVKNLVKSISVLGFTTPVVVTEDNVVLDGQHRLEALRQLGATTVPVVVVPKDKELEALLLLNSEKADNLKDICHKLYHLYIKLEDKFPSLIEKDLLEGLTSGYVPALAFSFAESGLKSPALLEDVVKHFVFFKEMPLNEAIKERRKEAELLKALDSVLQNTAEAYGIKDYVLKKALLSKALKSCYGDPEKKRGGIVVTDPPEVAVPTLIGAISSTNWSFLAKGGEK